MQNILVLLVEHIDSVYQDELKYDAYSQGAKCGESYYENSHHSHQYKQTHWIYLVYLY